MKDKREYLCFNGADILVAAGAVKSLDWKKKWRITIQPYRKNRTTDQNNLMWHWYTEIANHTGHTPDEIHDFCKSKFIALKTITIGNEQRECRTTTNFNTTEMSEYLERIRAWAHTDLGVALSDWGEKT